MRNKTNNRDKTSVSIVEPQSCSGEGRRPSARNEGCSSVDSLEKVEGKDGSDFTRFSISFVRTFVLESAGVAEKLLGNPRIM